MHPLYDDITTRITDPPLWWDSNGCPRYDPFVPTMCRIYAEYGALILIACQSCGRQFKVGSTWDVMQATQKRMVPPDFKITAEIQEDGSTISMGVHWDKDGKNGKPVNFPSADGPGEFGGFGDAPWHTDRGEMQCTGTTMGVNYLKVAEFWRRSWNTEHPSMEWFRLPEYEVIFDPEA